MQEMRWYSILRCGSRVMICAAAFAASSATIAADAQPSPRELWNREQTPFKVFGNTYYVGTRGLGSVLVVSEQGHVLIDSALPESAPLIAASVRALGFRVKDIRLIVNSHTHSDHAGGIAELQRLSGARVAGSASAAAALKLGRGASDDPQFEYGDSFPAVRQVQVVGEGETLKAGAVAITAHYTPGHTPGATSWTWKSCEKGRCLNMVYLDSLNPVSDDTFKFSGDQRYPAVLEDFTESLRSAESLPCDILLAPHPEFADLWGRLERRASGDRDALIDTTACRRYVEAARHKLDLRIEQEIGTRQSTGTSAASGRLLPQPDSRE